MQHLMMILICLLIHLLNRNDVNGVIQILSNEMYKVNISDIDGFSPLYPTNFSGRQLGDEHNLSDQRIVEILHEQSVLGQNNTTPLHYAVCNQNCNLERYHIQNNKLIVQRFDGMRTEQPLILEINVYTCVRRMGIIIQCILQLQIKTLLGMSM